MSDITVEVLKDIRGEIREMRNDITGLGGRIDQTNERLDRLERRHVETETRLATELLAVVAAVNEVRDAIREDRGLRHAVADHEDRISRLERERPPSRA